PCEPQLPQAQYTLPTGERLGAGGVLRERRQRLGEAACTMVGERRGLHREAAPRAWISSRTRAGESGTASNETPRGARASETALARAGSGAMAPPSPMPLMPPRVARDGVGRRGAGAGWLSGGRGRR